eukprot:219980-Chlamydomonas_euryale.AAC.1
MADRSASSLAAGRLDLQVWGVAEDGIGVHGMHTRNPAEGCMDVAVGLAVWMRLFDQAGERAVGGGERRMTCPLTKTRRRPAQYCHRPALHPSPPPTFRLACRRSRPHIPTPQARRASARRPEGLRAACAASRTRSGTFWVHSPTSEAAQ